MTDQSSDEDNDLRLRISNSDSEEHSDDSDGSDVSELPENDACANSENEVDRAETAKQYSTSEWVQFNKKVISMRPLSKSAMVQFIHKASRTIKILRKKKGTPEQIESNNKKADRLVQEIGYIKGMKKDVIAKFALLHSKDEVTKIANSADSSMEYRVKAKIASMPKISKAAEDYHLKNPEWRESLFKLIQLAGRNMKKKRRKVQGKSKKSSKTNEGSRQNVQRLGSTIFKVRDNDVDSERFAASNFPEPPQELDNFIGEPEGSDEENMLGGTESEEEDDANEYQPSHGSDSEEPSLILRPSRSKTEVALRGNKQPNTIVSQHSNENRHGPRKTATKKIINLSQKRVSVSEESSEMSAKMNKTGDKGGERIQDINVIKQANTKRSHLRDSSDNEESEPQSKPEANIDPFFITSDNKEYKTLWKVEPADSFKNKNPKEPEFMFKNARPYKDVVSGKNKMGPSKKKVGRKEKKAGGKVQLSEISVENLHPSWQAKKKMSNVAFQGKKVVFGDD